MASNYELITSENIRRRGQEFDDIGKLLAEQLYSDRTHFIFELLQNAEDALARRLAHQPSSQFPRSVTFRLFPDRLELSHFGQPFDEADVRGICDVLKGTKKGDASQIGTFGIGFKSVYAFTASPEIHSGDEHFKIERYIRPTALAARPLADGETLFVFPFDHETETSAESYERIADRLQRMGPRTLLFLNNIEEINWNIHDDLIGQYRRACVRKSDPRWVVTIGEANGQEDTHEGWLKFERQVTHEEAASPVKVEVAFGVTYDPMTGKPMLIPVHDSELVAFFPTEKETHLGFLIQGPYRTTPARDNVLKDDQWNQRLIRETATLVVNALAQIREMGLLTVSLLNALPIRSDQFPLDGIFYPIYEQVRAALYEQPLLPTYDGGFVAGRDAKLARGADLVELLSPEQLGDLFARDEPYYWLSTDISETRTPDLRRYLMRIDGTRLRASSATVEDKNAVEEVRPETVARNLTPKFMAKQADAWVGRLYGFFLGHQKDRGFATILRRIEFIRLQDGRHVSPFEQDGSPKAYLPPDEHTTLPVVKREVVENPQAIEFLKSIGLREPDIVAEVLETIIPKYKDQETGPVSKEEHLLDIRKIVRALDVDSQVNRKRLIAVLSDTPFLLAHNDIVPTELRYAAPRTVYVPSPELKLYFAENLDVCFLEENEYSDETVDRLMCTGISRNVRADYRPPGFGGYVEIYSWRGRHKRGVDGFDPRASIDGLPHALNTITLEKAQFIWNFILIPHCRLVRGVVQSATRQSYENAVSTETLSAMGQLLVEIPWLPARTGEFHRPCELSLDELPDEFTRNDALAFALKMMPNTLSVLARTYRCDPDALRTFLENPKKAEEIVRKLKEDEADEDDRVIPADGQDSLNYRAALNETFSKPGQNGPSEPAPAPKPVSNPSRKREREQKEIQGSQAAEPKPEARFKRVSKQVWEAKDNQVRTFLREEYDGKCQICGSSFPKRDGPPYFEGLHLVSRTNARWIDRPGNVLCLCATCCAKFQHGAVEVEQDVAEQVEQIRTRQEGDIVEPVLRIRLCEHDEMIRFTERHMIDLQEMLRASDDT